MWFPTNEHQQPNSPRSAARRGAGAARLASAHVHFLCACAHVCKPIPEADTINWPTSYFTQQKRPKDFISDRSAKEMRPNNHVWTATGYFSAHPSSCIPEQLSELHRREFETGMWLINHVYTKFIDALQDPSIQVIACLYRNCCLAWANLLTLCIIIVTIYS